VKNTKALVGQILIFVAVVAVSVGFVYAVYIVGSQTAAEILFRDELSSFSLVADTVVNSPNCLLYVETKNIAEETQVMAHRGVIDWSKASDSIKGCARKGAYIWNAVVVDETAIEESYGEFSLETVEFIQGLSNPLELWDLVKDLSNPADISLRIVEIGGGAVSDVGEVASLLGSIDDNTKRINGIPSGCVEIGKRSFPVIIKRRDKFDKGKVEVSVASKNAIVTTAKAGLVFDIVILNTGTCAGEYNIAVSIVNSTSDQQSNIPIILGIPPATSTVMQYTATTPSINVNETAIRKISVPNQNLAGYSLKIEISPKDIPYYTKIYRENL